MRIIPRSSAVLAALVLGACDREPLTTPDPPPIAAEVTTLRCTVLVRPGSLSCDPASPQGVRSNLILGGQGVNVRLTSANAAYVAADSVLSAEVRVQNLLDQRIGTDGIGPTYGVRVFFAAGPTVTTGEGQVRVLADSVGTFTAANQPYYLYPGILERYAISQPRTWRFHLPDTVERFDFLVLVETRTPMDHGALHWYFEWDRTGTPGVNGISGSSADDVWAVAANRVLHRTASGAWESRTLPTVQELRALFVASPQSVFAVGDAGVIFRYDGATWHFVQSDPSNDWRAAWGTSPGNVWLAGTGGTLAHWDGTQFQFMQVGDGAPYFNSIWAASSGEAFAVALNGSIWHWDGTEWKAMVASTGTTLLTVWGSGPDDVYAGGFSSQVYHYDGNAQGTWTATPVAGIPGGVYRVWGTSASDVYLQTCCPGALVHWNGSVWHTAYYFHWFGQGTSALWGTSPRDIYVGGAVGIVHGAR